MKKQHAAALRASGVAPFVLYAFRYACITRWAKRMGPLTLHVLAGHTDMNTTKRYVHPSEADILEAMARVQSGRQTASLRHATSMIEIRPARVSISMAGSTAIPRAVRIAGRC